jgi:SAM (Sterile alpha motif) domain-containing protein/adenylate/guanylate cyclase family protein
MLPFVARETSTVRDPKPTTRRPAWHSAHPTEGRSPRLSPMIRRVIVGCDKPRRVFAFTDDSGYDLACAAVAAGEQSVDIAAWLHGPGLQRYERTFCDNAIDASVLPELTADDLKELGVRLVGHRRKLLAAIAALRSDIVPVLDTPVAASTVERRQLTVMFCDLVGSTPLSSRLDPEDLREVIAAYHRAVAEIVAGFDGFVSRYMGDGVLAYFGYPQAHEDDAERAVRAGLGAVDAVGRLDVKSVKLQTRVGIATGLSSAI